MKDVIDSLYGMLRESCGHNGPNKVSIASLLPNWVSYKLMEQVVVEKMADLISCNDFGGVAVQKCWVSPNFREIALNLHTIVLWPKET